MAHTKQGSISEKEAKYAELIIAKLDEKNREVQQSLDDCYAMDKQNLYWALGAFISVFVALIFTLMKSPGTGVVNANAKGQVISQAPLNVTNDEMTIEASNHLATMIHHCLHFTYQTPDFDIRTCLVDYFDEKSIGSFWTNFYEVIVENAREHNFDINIKLTNSPGLVSSNVDLSKINSTYASQNRAAWLFKTDIKVVITFGGNKAMPIEQKWTGSSIVVRENKLIKASGYSILNMALKRDEK